MKMEEIKEKQNDAIEINFMFNGKLLTGIEGQPVAAALIANGIRSIRNCEITGEARGIYCGIGHCYECRATINGTPSKRTCLTLLKEGMVVTSGNEISYGAEYNEC
ncbi:(2Fe-2S)-binding protein [Lysinibacillus sp. 54212]|uniref:(2Fe-2S)-binding protein n=1 Tax=Lysinibacillus sp. 54212 TaxID=3119829 RepID=UPI002FCAE658